MHALKHAPINLDAWIEKNKEFSAAAYQQQAILERRLAEHDGDDGRRSWYYCPDYHDDPGEELFIELRGEVTLKLIDPATKERGEVTVRQGELNPGRRMSAIRRSAAKILMAW